MSPYIKDLVLRFFLGGSAVAACYIVLQLLPWKSFAGIFAAFPAVMVAAVIMAGISGGSHYAAEVALGATAGMLGCTVCVLVAIIIMTYLHIWAAALVISLLAWLISSIIFINLMKRHFYKSNSSG
ncbi:hypothetical protein Dtox_2710 [Desulfofarcimen acetoxidans DSM 771]|jgi:hypothetical protein|uniref:DUF3147 family protein n=1 Tax=Desulfofarcimen acetoxidans (strain ATCC 49208 / DSM 771 / KCTC 5769 / VKM B-1644 / 5575) TaxID=485916 RepID=C8W1L8_DESAS|nr:DUF3147 family protein [Desulfofarcimen acetoxidans]ACV63489.1 hypothetical protein Dtox_2710 [Desulfofarcimen acetoxidans DSM 771]